MNNNNKSKDSQKRDAEETNQKLLQDELDRKIMNHCQGGFPLTPRPFEKWAEELELEEEELIERVRGLKERGALSRFGPVINTRAFGGASTLVAMSVPEDRFDEVANWINKKPQISHNYQREHELNMWFVISAKSEAKLEATLEEIQDKTGLKTYNMPMLEEYYIGVKFNF